MMKPYEMSSVIITGPKSLQEEIIKELHSLKVLHIVEHSKSEIADIGIPLESAGKLSEILVRVRAIIDALGISRKMQKFEPRENNADIESSVRKISTQLGAEQEELKKTEDIISKNYSLSHELGILKNIDIPLEYFSSYKSLSYLAGYVNKGIGEIKKDISAITKKFILIGSESKKRNFIVIFFDAKSGDNVQKLLQKNNFSQVNFTGIANLKGTASDNLKKIEKDMQRLNEEREQSMKRMEGMSKEHGPFLLASEHLLSEQLEKAEAPLKFASTPSSFLIKGWIPSESLQKSIERLNKKCNNKIYIHFEPAKKNDRVPVKQKNPKYAKPFEFFMDLYSIPTYREIDPTFFVFLTFPIFFGIMLGDIGYGIVSLALFWIIKRKMPKARNFFNILMLASFVSMLFGFVFGEFFGLEIYHPLVSREHETFRLLFIALAIGVIHVNIGLIAGFINVNRAHGFMAAVYEKAGWIVLELGVAMIALSYFNLISISPFIGAAFLGASILMIFKGEGIKGIFELPAIFTNILSYARLMAIGLSSVILAVIINDLAKDMFHEGGMFILIGILILVIGHVINLMLGLLGSFLHALRLHYVEFFSKFFQGGAKKYRPFGIRDEE